MRRMISAFYLEAIESEHQSSGRKSSSKMFVLKVLMFIKNFHIISSIDNRPFSKFLCQFR